MTRRTGNFYGINEALFSSALAAMVFSVLATQPLTIVGVTGLISLFNYTIYDIITRYDPAIYANFMCWTAIWAAIFHWIVAVCNFCDYMRYVTDFSSESFAMYVGIIYCGTFSDSFSLFSTLHYMAARSGAEKYRRSQGRRGAYQRVRIVRFNSWIPQLPHCSPVLPYRLRS